MLPIQSDRVSLFLPLTIAWTAGIPYDGYKGTAMLVKIVKTLGICSGDARIEGHRIKVRDILWHLEDLGQSRDEVAEDLGISLEAVDAALEYYRTHPEEIAVEEQRSTQVTAEFEKQYPSAFKEKLKRLKIESA